MPRVRVIHWRAAEAEPLIEACRGAGFEVEYLEGDGGAIGRAIRANPPDVIVIDLTRRPSHGQEIAVWLRGRKSSRDIPIVFADGDLAKVVAAIKSPARQTNPVTPVTREKSAAEKLGIVARSVVACVDAPRDFPELLGELPEAVEFQEDGDAAVTLWFVHDREGLLENLRRMRTMTARTKLWLVWRKGANGFAGSGVTQNTVREMTREVGLVDYKICSVDARWSGMLFARKKA
jgi:hypothetical protein